MKKRDVVKSNLLFNDIINKGHKVSNEYFIICRMKKEKEANNYGIAVGKKIGNAVMRNHVKRQVRNIITHNMEVFPKFHNYIIIVKKEALNIPYDKMETMLVNLIKKENTYEK